jgi:hypothetical protein
MKFIILFIFALLLSTLIATPINCNSGMQSAAVLSEDITEELEEDGENVLGFGFTIPKVTIPPVTIPQVSIPQVTTPKVTTPQVSIPQVVANIPLTLSVYCENSP